MHYMRLLRLACLLPSSSALAAAAGVDATDQHAEQRVKQVAVIGAGAGGSSAAYHLRKYAQQAGIEVNITVFEKTARIGGRTLTVNVYDDPVFPVELGASIFVAVNHILFNATKEFGLPVTEPGATDEKGILGVWDGKNFVYTQDSESWGWWNLAKLVWKYGTTPYYTNRLVQRTIATFLKLYEAPYFPFRSLSTRAFELGLVQATSVTGLQFLAENELDGPFAHDIVQTSTRVNYASNLPYIHGLGTMVAMAPEGAMAVAGGNWQIFSHMVTHSQAYVSLNSTVTSITKEESGNPDSASPRYQIKTAAPEVGETTHPITFDDVILAAPYQFSGIQHADDLIPHPVDTIPYVKLHVTLFSSPYRFSPAFFGLEPASRVPSSVLTTLGPDEEAPEPGSSGNGSAGSAGFFSATLVKTVTNPRTQSKEYVYKIFSPEKVTPGFLSKLLGVQIPETFVTETEKGGDEEKEEAAEGESATTLVEPISWYYPAVFHPYPQKYPRVTFQDPILGDGLWYTSGVESFISTMETSALMGMNVARLIVDDYLSVSRAAAGDIEKSDDVVAEVTPPVLAEEKAQDVLAGQQSEVAEDAGEL
ncbi:prenylcysteine oxidase [Durotheca rogersii]|uniref:prenylcysteine oxidase n=1 Tax=Durotheca rogersii TaxID=419775 RepID=UPI00221E3FBB|nr:prenylcysteine oxidase [Durotheca rogersii]KAI5863861.1 prenylcysteine oxidase [Durotheca rogersii]